MGVLRVLIVQKAAIIWHVALAIPRVGCRFVTASCGGQTGLAAMTQICFVFHSANERPLAETKYVLAR